MEQSKDGSSQRWMYSGGLSGNAWKRLFALKPTQHNSLSPSEIKWDQRDQCDVQARTKGWAF